MCRNVLALMDRKSLVNVLEPVGNANVTAGVHSVTSPNLCTRQLIAAPHSWRRRSVWLQSFPPRLEAQPLQTCRAAKKPWPNQLTARRKSRRSLPVNSSFSSTISEAWISRSQGGFSPSSQTRRGSQSDLQGVSTMKRATQVVERFEAENAGQTPRKSGSSSPFVCSRARLSLPDSSRSAADGAICPPVVSLLLRSSS